MEEETTVWQGHPSQILNLHIFLLCGLAAGALIAAGLLFQLQFPVACIVGSAAIIPLFFAFVKWLQIKFQKYELTTERLRLRCGVLSRKTDEVELYRVKDYVLHEPLSLRLFGLGNVALTTTDDANPSVLLRAVSHPETLRDQIRKHVELRREAKRVRITEME
ncbi:MAG: PH domain-containing protein [Verrucomicrobia subdivision 3 bacterium]|nr:PH domain-containing protein [Limisphaerales bacterium]